MTNRTAPRVTRTILGSARLHRFLERVIHPFRGSAPGASMVEYMVVLGFVSLFAILAFNRFGRTLHLAYQSEAEHIKGHGIPGSFSLLDDLGGLTDPDDLCDIVTGVCRPCSGMCFGAGTLVATEAGNRPIEELLIGDLVWATSEKTGETALRPILSTFVNPDAEVLDLDVRRGPALAERIEVTPAHRFWVPKHGWSRADRLADAPLWSQADRLAKTSLWSEAATLLASASPVKRGLKTVYNIEVEEFHTYHVGQTGVLVHNQNSTPCPRNPGAGPGNGAPVPNDGVLQCGEVGQYNELPSSSTQQRDHVPSGGALRKRAETLYFDAPLTKEQQKDMTDSSAAYRRFMRRVEAQGLTIAIPNDVHKDSSETYGGKNTYDRRLADSRDLQAAARSNIAAIQAALAGTPCAEHYAAAAQEILDMTQADYDARLQAVIDTLTPEEREEIDEAYEKIRSGGS
jgi:hypothetical protein